MSQEIAELARKYALENAVNHGGKATPGPIIGKLMNADPELKHRIAEVKEFVAEAVKEVNSLDRDVQIHLLKELAPELLEKEKVVRVAELSELEEVDRGVIMRLAPNPSGPLHIGHTRMAILNDEYVKRYDGKLIVRMEDTNPETILPEAYDMILNDLDYLGVKYHEVICQSSRFDVYYEWAEKLIELGKAYLCTCEPDSWRELKDKNIACPHRSAEPDANLELWRRMMAGEFEPGEISVVIKTDLEHPNPAVRDFVALRILDQPHPKTGDSYRVLPLYNFSVAIDDHLMEMTHVLRGKDHLNNTLRQEYVYDHLGWKKPIFIHYGWVSIEDTVLSTRQIKAAIDEGKYIGWDDVRLGTVAALAKRGIQPDAIRKFWLEVGTKGVDIRFSWQNLYAYNKSIIDKLANRYFFVWDPAVVKIEGADKLEGKAPLLPDNPEAGYRHTILESDNNEIYVQLTETDLSGLKPADLVRLKDLCNLEYLGEKRFRYIGDDLELLKHGARIIHWVGPDNVKTRIYMPDGERIEGVAESAAVNSAGQIVQFERFGFVKIEVGDEGIIGYFAHK